MERPPILDTRDRILRAALDLFAVHGYQRTPLRAIADRLEMTKAGVLYHFPSKEHLLAALVEPLLSDLESSLDRAALLPWPASRWAALEGWLDTLLRHRRPLGTLYHDMALLARGVTFARIMRLAQTAYSLVAGAEPTRLERVRAVQAVAILGDPIVFFADVPDDELRADILDGVARLLTERLAGPGTSGPGTSGPGTSGPGTSGPGTTTDGTEPAPDPRRTTADGAEPADMTAGRAGTARIAPARAGAEPHPAERPGAGRRTRSGRRTAGRPRALSAEQVSRVRAMHDAGAHSVEEIAASLGVSRSTVYRQLRDIPAGADETGF